MNSKPFVLLFAIILLSAGACVPVAFDIPEEITFPSLATLEKKLDLPLLRLGDGEVSTSFRQECTSGSIRKLIPSGIASTEIREVDDFSMVVLTGHGSIQITQAERSSVSIQADKTLLPFLETEIFDDQLILGIQKDVCIEYSEIGVTYDITVENLEGLHIIGVGDVRLDELELEQLHIQLDGSAQIAIDGIQVDQLETFLNGTGVIEISGTTVTQSLNLNGVGQYRAADLFSESADVELNGTGHVEVWAESDLQMQLNGLGTLSYFGNPEVASKVSGLSGVTYLGLK